MNEERNNDQASSADAVDSSTGATSPAPTSRNEVSPDDARPKVPQTSEDAPATESDAEELPSSNGLLFKGPIDIRSISLTGLFLIAAFHTLFVARSIFIPLVLAILLSLMLRPPVRFLARRGVPDSIGAGALMFVLTVTLAGSFYWLSTPAATWLNEIPRTVRTIEWKLRSLEEPMQKVKEVSDAVESAASVGDDASPQIKVKKEGLLGYVLGQTQGVLLMTFLTAAFLFFLLASGDLFLRKLVRVIPRFQDKKQAVEIVHQIQNDIASYIFSITIINMGLGIAIALAMFGLGMPNPALWGMMAFVLNFIPYIGAMSGVAVVGIVGFVQGDTLGFPLLVMAVYLALTTLEGTIATPMIVGKKLRLNPVVVFLALIVWGWLWGIPGALLAVPILATIKILCDRIEPLNPIGEFIGG